MRALAMTCLLLGGCPLVYDSQYDDRATELEEFRTEIFPVADNVQRFASGGERLYWVDVKRPSDQNVLHSIAPPNFTAIDYDWSVGNTTDQILKYHFSDQLIVTCTFGTTKAFSVGGSITEIGSTSGGEDDCAVDGTTVYFRFGTRIDRWVPNGTAAPTTIVDFELDNTGITNGIDGMGVIGNLAVVTESGGDIYTLDLTTKKATWLENDVQVSGNVFFDERGAIFDTVNADGPRYIQFEGKVESSFKSLVADGGYHLFEHGDVQEPDEPSEFVIHGKHIIYRGLHGIFAYGLETRNVVDLLLDRGKDFDAVEYHSLTVTANGFLYVQTGDLFGSMSESPVYQVDLNGRLK